MLYLRQFTAYTLLHAPFMAHPVCLWTMIHSGESPEKMTSPATSGNRRESVCVMQHILNVCVCDFATATTGKSQICFHDFTFFSHQKSSNCLKLIFCNVKEDTLWQHTRRLKKSLNFPTVTSTKCNIYEAI